MLACALCAAGLGAALGWHAEVAMRTQFVLDFSSSRESMRTQQAPARENARQQGGAGCCGMYKFG